MQDQTFTFEGTDGAEITAYRWDPDGAARGVVQLTHGMGEHVLRYDEVARAFTAAGLVVYGQDHRGHGASAMSTDTLGQLGADGWPALVEDIGRLSTRVRAEQPGLPLVLLAHSMGSFATQQFLLEASDRIDGVVLTGTAVLDLLEPTLDLDNEFDLAMFNAPFQPSRTDFDWLSRDEQIVDAYIADPRCGFGLDTEGVKAMFAAARRVADPEQVVRIRSDLPMYLAVGESDPANGNLALFQPLVDRYRAAGLSDITVRTYPEARHEILNETNRAEIIDDLRTWILRTIDSAKR